MAYPAACPWDINHKSNLLHPRRTETFLKCFIGLDVLFSHSLFLSPFSIFSLTGILIEHSINNKAKLANTKLILQIHMVYFHSIAVWLLSLV